MAERQRWRFASRSRLAELARDEALEDAAMLVDCSRLAELTDLGEIAASIRKLKDKAPVLPHEQSPTQIAATEKTDG